MNRKQAGFSFLIVCVILAVLLLTQTISPFVNGIIFAAALVVFGGLSKGFRNDNDPSKASMKSDTKPADPIK